MNLIVLSNFKITVFPGDETITNTIKNYTDLVSSCTQSETYLLTSTSYWRGLNKELGDDFLATIKTTQVPSNVLAEVESWFSKFGSVILVNDDCVNISNPNLQQEILNHSVLKKHISNVQGSLIFFKNITLDQLQDIFETEVNHPIKIHKPSENKIEVIEAVEVEETSSGDSFESRKNQIKDKQMDILFKEIVPLLKELKCL